MRKFDALWWMKFKDWSHQTLPPPNSRWEDEYSRWNRAYDIHQALFGRRDRLPVRRKETGDQRLFFRELYDWKRSDPGLLHLVHSIHWRSHNGVLLFAGPEYGEVKPGVVAPVSEAYPAAYRNERTCRDAALELAC